MTWQEEWEEFKTRVWNRYFLFLSLSVIFLVSSWTYVKTNKGLNIISLVLFIGLHILYAVKVTWRNEKSLPKFFDVIQWIVLSLLWATYVFLSVGEASTGIVLFILLVFLVFLFPPIISFIFMKDSKSMKGLIFSYLLFSVLINVLFGFSYALASGVPSNGIISRDANATSVQSPYTYIFYSFSNYYSDGYVNVYEKGMLTNSITTILILCSAVIHIIVLGTLINNLKDDAVRPRIRNRTVRH